MSQQRNGAPASFVGSLKRSRVSRVESGNWNASASALASSGLVCLPFRFGIQPLGLEISKSIPFNLVGSAESIFQVNEEACSNVELFQIRDFGTRLMLYQSLAWMVWFIMRQSTANLKAFHKLLIATSLGSLLTIAWQQNVFHPAPPAKPLDAQLFREIVICYGLGILLSSWTTLVYAKAPLEAMKWSIPANALFWCGVSTKIVNELFALAISRAEFTFPC